MALPRPLALHGQRRACTRREYGKCTAAAHRPLCLNLILQPELKSPKARRQVLRRRAVSLMLKKEGRGKGARPWRGDIYRIRTNFAFSELAREMQPVDVSRVLEVKDMFSLQPSSKTSGRRVPLFHTAKRNSLMLA